MIEVIVIFGLVMALAFTLLYHCYKIRGGRETILFMIITGGVGASVEFVGVTSGGYGYTGQTLFITILFTGIGWTANTYLAMHMATFMLGGYEKKILHPKDIFKIALLASSLGVLYDLFTDPVATAFKIWVWSYEGPWYGVPTTNFIGWFAILFFNIIGYYLILFHVKTQKHKIILALPAILIITFFVVSIMNICRFLNIR